MFGVRVIIVKYTHLSIPNRKLFSPIIVVWKQEKKGNLKFQTRLKSWKKDKIQKKYVGWRLFLLNLEVKITLLLKNIFFCLALGIYLKGCPRKSHHNHHITTVSLCKQRKKNLFIWQIRSLWTTIYRIKLLDTGYHHFIQFKSSSSSNFR